ncbi:MAG: class I SAM-dependent rRNA methyltransferase [Bdellovibrionaceae bacterium]|nr:class I SAM-dependent rRNA methyltransferase [Pseudobdellovibrionaceae bacterium]
MTIWRLQPGADKRIRGGHPWVFSNELSGSPKGHIQGAPITLQDSKGSFLAHGYGNPHSLIAFRAVSFEQKEDDCLQIESLVNKVISAWGHRRMLGYERSFRLVFGECDFLPGLVIDRYLLEAGGQVLAIQITTAGMEKALTDLEYFSRRIAEEAMESGLTTLNWASTAVVIRADVNVRKLEGLEVKEPKVIKEIEGFDLRNAWVLVDAVGFSPVEGQSQPGAEKPIAMKCDLVEGQKTGFFLDQSWNIEILGQLLKRNPHFESHIRILDLCCYVGQWSTKLTRLFKSMGFEVDVELVDVSASALAFAKENAEREGARVLARELDVMEELGKLPDRHYDVVIADPPAFIKAKKDLPTGKHAYLKFNTQAFRLVNKGGLVASCSCSGLFPEEELRDVVRKSLQRNHVQARMVGKGGHAPDHPTLVSFPESAYLKMLVHQVAF